MTDSELIQAIGNIVREQISPLDKRLGSIETDIAEMKNDIEEIKEHVDNIETAVGAITDWVDKASEVNKVPFLKAL